MNETADVYGAQAQIAQDKDGDMGLPNVSPTEEYLLKKFALLKKKRKVLQRSKEKAECAQNAKSALKREAQDSPHAPQDAKEIAKRLIASGEVKIKRDPVQKEFKRSKSNTDRRHKDGQQGQNATSATSDQPKVLMKNLYDSFVPAGRNRRFSGSGGHLDGRGEGPRKGNTIFVSGYNLTEDILPKAFEKFGKIQRINFEKEKRHGFVTFDTSEAADAAIAEMNGNMFSGIHLKVHLARRQPALGDSRSSAKPMWVNRDARGSIQSSQCDKREQVSYDDLF